jgi:mRNA-degrading endonuclease RelE of RelBE toxin-antitoxin system
MSDKIEKFLAKLTLKERDLVQATLLDIIHGELEHLDCKPLKGHQNIYRVRKGSLRIIFSVSPKMNNIPENVRILQIGRRDERTYSQF